ncbi:MAG: twin-arginine translocase TatA/TatE family subunit [Lachnospiraceae bacterium]|nr:twin-arginine translocase TatA/TatE family subunit [Lachnospiraceae bacterium]
MHLGTTELLLILALAILIFGGTRLAGLGKAMGKSVREFKEEVKSDDKKNDTASSADASGTTVNQSGTDTDNTGAS